MVISRLSYLRLLALFMLMKSTAAEDVTTCLRDFEDRQSLHFVCFCEDQSIQVTNEVEFSLAEFVFNLSGTIFSKSVLLTFRQCRFLKIRLDQKELSRIGSDFFRPDLSVRAIAADHVYHLHLARADKDDDANESEDHENAAEIDDDADYINTPSKGLTVSTTSVGLIVLERGADFHKVVSGTNGTTLYIDLTQKALMTSEEAFDDVNVSGFRRENIFFVTNSDSRVPLNEGEDLQVKIKALTSEMQDQSHKLSLALSLSTIVILIGIFGLIVVAHHRQKRKRQLKEILRAKNLGPVLESRKIASEVSSSFLSKKRANDDPGRNFNRRRFLFMKKLKWPLKKKSKGQESVLKLPMNTADIEPAASNGNNNSSSNMSKIFHMLDVNEFLSGIMYRMRKNHHDFTTNVTASANDQAPALTSATKRNESLSGHKRSDDGRLETSFYYKESSLTPSSSATSASDQSARSRSKSRAHRSKSGSRSKSRSRSKSKPRRSSADEDMVDVDKDFVEVAVEKKSSKRSSSGTESTTSGSTSKTNSESGSYVSKISHFVTYTTPQEVAAVVAKQPQQDVPPPLPAKPSSLTQYKRSSHPEQRSRHNSSPKKPPAPPPPLSGQSGGHVHDSNKCMTFFSSVTKARKDNHQLVDDNTKL